MKVLLATSSKRWRNVAGLSLHWSPPGLPVHCAVLRSAVRQLEAEQRRATEVESFYKQRAAGQVRFSAAPTGSFMVVKVAGLACQGEGAIDTDGFKLLRSHPPLLPACV